MKSRLFVGFGMYIHIYIFNKYLFIFYPDVDRANFSQGQRGLGRRKSGFTSPGLEVSAKVAATPIRPNSSPMVSPKGEVAARGLKRGRSACALNTASDSFDSEIEPQNPAKKYRRNSYQNAQNCAPLQTVPLVNKKNAQMSDSDSPGNPGAGSAQPLTPKVSILNNSQPNRVAKPSGKLPRVSKLSPVDSSCVQCQVPGCKMFIHKSNMSRHLISWHQGILSPWHYS